MAVVNPLENTGLVELRPERRPAPDEPRTLVVVGPARSGTSAVAGVLHHLGIFMGDEARPPVFEDVRLARALEGGTVEQARSIIRDYDARHAVWGFKRPLNLERTRRSAWKPRRPTLAARPAQKESLLRRPQFLVTFKDLLAIANRNRLSGGQDFQAGLRRAQSEYGQILDFVEGTDASVLLISYEKLMNRAESAVIEIARFCGMPEDVAGRSAATAFLVRDPAHYIAATRSTRAKGSLDQVTSSAVLGWARYVRSERPATVVLYVDGVEVARTSATLFRKDLLEKRVHPTGCCAYRFEGLSVGTLRPGSEVRVRIEDDVVDLSNSPRRVPS